ncbi:MAG: hypothetical protein B7W97_00725 [Mycobacterium sp. 20-66-4]|nr:MAG: hypothetical protein B7W97_00725 [Mycobacterium sp. 20-66-4]
MRVSGTDGRSLTNLAEIEMLIAVSISCRETIGLGIVYRMMLAVEASSGSTTRKVIGEVTNTWRGTNASTTDTIGHSTRMVIRCGGTAAGTTNRIAVRPDRIVSGLGGIVSTTGPGKIGMATVDIERIAALGTITERTVSERRRIMIVGMDIGCAVALMQCDTCRDAGAASGTTAAATFATAGATFVTAFMTFCLTATCMTGTGLLAGRERRSRRAGILTARVWTTGSTFRVWTTSSSATAAARVERHGVAITGTTTSRRDGCTVRRFAAGRRVGTTVGATICRIAGALVLTSTPWMASAGMMCSSAFVSAGTTGGTTTSAATGTAGH